MIFNDTAVPRLAGPQSLFDYLSIRDVNDDSSQADYLAAINDRRAKTNDRKLAPVGGNDSAFVAGCLITAHLPPNSLRKPLPVIRGDQRKCVQTGFKVLPSTPGSDKPVLVQKGDVSFSIEFKDCLGQHIEHVLESLLHISQLVLGSLSVGYVEGRGNNTLGHILSIDGL